MRLTADLARDSPAYINPLRQRELSLRGFKIPVIENLGFVFAFVISSINYDMFPLIVFVRATQDQYQVIDLSDNEILKLDNFPMMLKLEVILLTKTRAICFRLCCLQITAFAG